MLRFHSLALRLFLASCLLLYFVGCGDAETTEQSTSFVSHVPGTSSGADSSADGRASLEASGTGGAAAPNVDVDAEGTTEAERAIAEADIIKIEGTTLYALSRYSGLSVIDVNDPENLVLLGNHRTSATPFEMYVEGDRAYVMYNGWGRYVYDEDAGYYSWETSSRIQALNISNPSNIAVLGDQKMPGNLSDSRKVGDVLYLVTHENGYCWECASTSNTRVTSFNVSDPDDFQLIDELRLENTETSGGQRSISVTTERIYISGWDWGGDDSGVIDVVDISDPEGDLVAGAQIEIAGPIESRWQINEYEGALRVISQPGGWGTSTPPVVETFHINSSDSFEPLASLDMVLPRPEDLRSVRFDGDRAYAITFERTDPLFTFDLSNPENPQQVGELEIPGWVYHMEPRGDRIYALGFENDNSAGSLHVSLFDVSTLSDPQQIARVNFGGSWGSFAEDQDRIHKAFNIMPDEGLILVPFSGWEYEETGELECSQGSYRSGIQLVDMTEDSLTLRGVAPQVGQARRGFLMNDTLVGVSDNAVQTFDIADRNAPASLGRLEIARNIQNIRLMGSTMLRFGSDWWTGETMLDFARLEEVDQAEPLGNIDLSSYEIEEDSCRGHSYWENQVLVHGKYAYVPRRGYEYLEDGGDYKYRYYLTFYIVDLSERTSPQVVGTFSIETKDDEEYLSGIVMTENAVLVGRGKGHYYYNVETGEQSDVSFSYDVISLEDPANPEVVSQIQVPSNVASGGFGYNVSGCAIDLGWGWWGGYYYGYYGGSQQALVSGNIVASQHQEPLDDGTGRVKYFLDRIDVSDPEHPVLLEPVNIPGTLVDFNDATGRLVTVDYLYEENSTEDGADCRNGYFDSEASTCRIYRRNINTLTLNENLAELVDRQLIDEGNTWASSVAVGDGRIFASYYDYQNADDGTQVRTLAMGSTGRLTDLGAVTLEAPAGNLLARGNRAFLSSYGVLNVINAENEDTIETTEHEMGGYSCNSLEVSESYAYCALGYQGVQAFPLD